MTPILATVNTLTIIESFIGQTKEFHCSLSVFSLSSPGTEAFPSKIEAAPQKFGNLVILGIEEIPSVIGINLKK